MTFRDDEGREWTLRVTVGSLRRCVGGMLDLVQGEPPPLARYQLDPLAACDAIASMLGPELAARGVTRDSFLESLGGDAAAAAQAALLRELTDFFQRCHPLVAQAAAQISREVGKGTTEAIAAISGESSTTPPASSA
ncbi:MAG: hypothetical protein LC136_09250 [Burkholderiales bacterium]|nr:hypothetical protein [Gemmatimonadaceae bacterium]MCZ2414424.1 hypothetical protein [Burkholderiales bacterium]